MINLELALKLAKEYGFEVNKVNTGDGGMFYIDSDNRKVKVNDLNFDDDIEMSVKLSLEKYKMYGRGESMYIFAA